MLAATVWSASLNVILRPAEICPLSSHESLRLKPGKIGNKRGFDTMQGDLLAALKIIKLSYFFMVNKPKWRQRKVAHR
jgi:hypothetical protein